MESGVRMAGDRTAGLRDGGVNGSRTEGCPGKTWGRMRIVFGESVLRFRTVEAFLLPKGLTGWRTAFFEPAALEPWKPA